MHSTKKIIYINNLKKAIKSIQKTQKFSLKDSLIKHKIIPGLENLEFKLKLMISLYRFINSLKYTFKNSLIFLD